MVRYFINTDSDLERMQQDLETIANMTQDAEERVVYMKDSMTVAQKSNTAGNTTNMNPRNTSTHLASGQNAPVTLCCLWFALM